MDYIVYLNANYILWISKKQLTVSRFNSEVKYWSMTFMVTELTWMESLLQEIGVSLSTIPQLFCNNINTLHMSINPKFHAKMKYIELNYYFV